MTPPTLKQSGDLGADDFSPHPVWLACHTADYDEPWFDDTDEETFRPWTGELPADPSYGMFLVRTTVVFRDASTFEGFVTPSHSKDDLGTMQPHGFHR